MYHENGCIDGDTVPWDTISITDHGVEVRCRLYSLQKLVSNPSKMAKATQPGWSTTQGGYSNNLRPAEGWNLGTICQNRDEKYGPGFTRPLQEKFSVADEIGSVPRYQESPLSYSNNQIGTAHPQVLGGYV